MHRRRNALLLAEERVRNIRVVDRLVAVLRSHAAATSFDVELFDTLYVQPTRRERRRALGIPGPRAVAGTSWPIATRAWLWTLGRSGIGQPIEDPGHAQVFVCSDARFVEGACSSQAPAQGAPLRFSKEMWERRPLTHPTATADKVAQFLAFRDLPGLSG